MRKFSVLFVIIKCVRFCFSSTIVSLVVNSYNKIADITSPPPIHTEFAHNYNNNNNLEQVESNISNLQAKLRATTATTTDTNKNKPSKVSSSSSNFTQQQQISRFTLHTTQLPKPQLPQRVIETKTAKTLLNNSRKILDGLQGDATDSSKEGSLTEDSGVGSHTSDSNMQNIVNLECSPVVPRRSLGVVVDGNRFDVRDCEGDVVALPVLPSVLKKTGIVEERKQEYQWNLNRDNRRISADDERKTFLKPKRIASPFGCSSSDDWTAGEAMADDISCSFSSSISDDKHSSISQVIHNLAQATIAKTQPKTVLLSIEDQKFAAVAAATTNAGTLLQDETSPTDSLMGSYTESEEHKHKHNKHSDSKDINEKLSFTPPSPGTPTHASNSLSLSDGGKDFFVDDEIADQPALVFDDTLTPDNNQTSEATSITIVDSTPKTRRRSAEIKESPLTMRKKFLIHRSGSVDTLSPCESIASDDMMMDFEYSQSSGLDDLNDR